MWYKEDICIRKFPLLLYFITQFVYNIETVKRISTIIYCKIFLMKNVYGDIIKVLSKTFLIPITPRVFQTNILKLINNVE